MNSALYFGSVRHRRYTPAAHTFRYRTFMVYLDLDELDGVFRKFWLWSVGRPNLAWFNRTDYIGGHDEPIRLNELRSSYGTGLSWVSPMGPLRLAVANPVNKQSGDRITRLQFQIGNTF